MGFKTTPVQFVFKHVSTQFTARGFQSGLGTIAQWPCVSYLHPCASVTKQYNLVPANSGVGATSLNGKVTAGLVESNDT